MNKTWLIIKREFLTRVKKKSFILMTIFGPLFFVGLMAAAIFLSQQQSGVTEVVITDKGGQFAVLDTTLIKSSENVKFFFENGILTESEFEQSPYDCMVELLDAEDLREKSIPLVFKDNSPSILIQKKISNELEIAYQELIMIKNKLTKEQIESYTAKVNLQPQKVFEEAQDIPQEIGGVVGIMLAFMIYLFIFLYGMQIMRSVMEEKTSRIVEVIVSSVKPFQLMMGKIIGVALVGLIQFLIWIIFSSILFGILAAVFPDIFSGAGQVQAAESAMKNIEPGAIENVMKFIGQINFPFIIGMFLFYFIGGYLLYGSLFAAVGGAVDSETDSQQFMLPVSAPLIFAIYLAYSGILNPDGAAIYWASIFPFTSPIVMMMKVGMMGLGFIPIEWGTILLSMALLIAGFIFTTWIAGKIYRVGILMYGKKVNYKELWKWLTYKV